MKKRYILLLILLILLLVYLLGPRLSFPSFDGKLPQFNLSIDNVEQYVLDKESKVEKLKPDNEARIIWADSTKQKTEFAVLYVHGYSASPMEGDGIHTHFAERYACNIYMARLDAHGIKDHEAFLNVSSKDWIENTKEAIAITKTLGDKVVVLSASTGSTLVNYLEAENPGLIDGHLMYSPNFKMADQSSQILKYPWGLQVARKVMGSKYRVGRFNEQDSVHWTFKQRLEGVGALVHLVNHATGKKIYKKVKSPYMVAYYYKNEDEQDGAVSVKEMEKFHSLTSTPANQKRFIAFPESGDHCMVSTLRSKDLPGIRKESYAFAEEVLGMKPKIE